MHFREVSVIFPLTEGELGGFVNNAGCFVVPHVEGDVGWWWQHWFCSTVCQEVWCKIRMDPGGFALKLMEVCAKV